MTLNWRGAWPLLTASLICLAAEIQDIFDAVPTTVFQPELVIMSFMTSLGVLLGTISQQQQK